MHSIPEQKVSHLFAVIRQEVKHLQLRSYDRNNPEQKVFDLFAALNLKLKP